MTPEKRTSPEWITIADAVSLLDAPYRESPSLMDTSRAPFAFGLLLVPLLVIIVGIVGFVHTAITAFPLPIW